MGSIMTVATIAGRIRDVSRHVAILESDIAQFPDDPLPQVEMASLLRHQKDLRNQFEFAARESGVTVCKYRLFGNADKSFGKVCQTVAEFQKLYTLIYSAIKSGKRSRRQVPSEDEFLSTFGLAYTFAGSVGVALTLAQQRSLFDELADDNQFDQAMGTLCDLAKLDSTDKVRQYAADLGIGVIRELYEWSATHAQFSLGADIEWLHGRKVTRSVLVQHQELARLKSAIEVTSDVKDEPPFTVTGNLRGADTEPASFHFEIDGGKEIRGTFTDVITDANPLQQLPLRCRAEIFRKTIIKYATGEEIVTWHLLKLTPIPKSTDEIHP